MQPPGNHQMRHQPEIFFKAETDAFPETSQLNNLLTFNRRNRRCCSSQEKRRIQLDTFKCVIENPLFQRFDVDRDVRQLRHARKINAGVGGRERLEVIEFERSSQQRRRRRALQPNVALVSALRWDALFVLNSDGNFADD
jgi:hypothetical protein